MIVMEECRPFLDTYIKLPFSLNSVRALFAHVVAGRVLNEWVRWWCLISRHSCMVFWC